MVTKKQPIVSWIYIQISLWIQFPWKLGNDVTNSCLLLTNWIFNTRTSRFQLPASANLEIVGSQFHLVDLTNVCDLMLHNRTVSNAKSLSNHCTCKTFQHHKSLYYNYYNSLLQEKNKKINNWQLQFCNLLKMSWWEPRVPITSWCPLKGYNFQLISGLENPTPTIHPLQLAPPSGVPRPLRPGRGRNAGRHARVRAASRWPSDSFFRSQIKGGVKKPHWFDFVA